MVINTLVIGASIAGLAVAASLQKQGIEYAIIEKSDCIAAPWHRHYDRLHLHTSKKFSHLPYKKFDHHIPRYPARQQVIEYLNEYKSAFNIEPLFNTEAFSVKRIDGVWITQTDKQVIESKYVVMATGAFAEPRTVFFKGMETFPGKIVHSSEYKTGADFSGQKVLVVGFGNSACEIAIDLFEQGAKPVMSVRSRVNIVPRDVLGIPVLELSILLNPLPPPVADLISKPLMKLLIGDIGKLGLQQMPYGPLTQIQRDHKAPVLDVGTIKHIRQGNIQVMGGVDHIADNIVYFKNGRVDKFDAIIAAIGFRTINEKIVHVEKERFGDLLVSVDHQKYFGKDGLYFCGYWISPTGQIREIAQDAMKIAKDIAGRIN
ncbi:flavin-containing monooxygenase [Pinibacter aurantiacus]|uniref:NAD(P)/FAD-dependent oxidoreductase n=1 Tax=Pinibacter aurantiacus TaxID=2851599 RepID=A0A9E2SFH0_9BACT|nr:NAD(P)/FAD-dependent oxidoreductase [Pinibacter aurantiacus]MBV4359275.1 NAD(P)/FAD-dependent oxidoreductase [Pinibacter aurantiacus]